MVRHVHTVERVDTIGEFVKAEQLATTRLTSSDLERQTPETAPEGTNWLELLTVPVGLKKAQADGLSLAESAASGMSAHRTPSRLAPTIGSRLTTGLRRTVLLATLGILAAGVLAMGAYVVASTTWLSQLLSPMPPATGTRLIRNTSQPQAPVHVQARPPEISNPRAIELRDKGIQQYKAGNFSASVDLLENSVNVDGGDAVAYYQLGLAYIAVEGREHALDDAEMAFRSAISLQPRWGAPHQLLAETLLRQGFYKEAIASALEATRLDATQPDAWMTLGRAYQGAGQQSEANQAFAEAARHAPSKNK